MSTTRKFRCPYPSQALNDAGLPLRRSNHRPPSRNVHPAPCRDPLDLVRQSPRAAREIHPRTCAESYALFDKRNGVFRAGRLLAGDLLGGPILSTPVRPMAANPRCPNHVLPPNDAGPALTCFLPGRSRSRGGGLLFVLRSIIEASASAPEMQKKSLASVSQYIKTLRGLFLYSLFSVRFPYFLISLSRLLVWSYISIYFALSLSCVSISGFLTTLDVHI